MENFRLEKDKDSNPAKAKPDLPKPPEPLKMKETFAERIQKPKNNSN